MVRVYRVLSLISVGFLTFSMVQSNAQDPSGPHPWCHRLTMSILADDNLSTDLVERFSSQLSVNFDVKGYHIERRKHLRELVAGIRENKIDFAVVPFHEGDSILRQLREAESAMNVDEFRSFAATERLYILGDCCKGMVEKVERRGADDFALGEKAKVNYKIVASPRIFEMGYSHKDLMYQAATQSIDKFVKGGK